MTATTNKFSVLCDLDGTLIDTEVCYTKVLDEFSDLMAGLDFHPVLARNMVLQTDTEKALKGDPPFRARFPNSMVEAYQAMCVGSGRVPHLDVMRLAYEIGDSVYGMRASIIDGAAECAESLAARYALHIYTMGDREVQVRRVAETGLAHHFTSVHILKAKNPDTLGALLDAMFRKGYPPVTWLIGNSPRTDILPALFCGLRAVWVGAPGYAYDHHELPVSGAYMGGSYIRATNLAAIPSLIENTALVRG